MNGGSEGHKEKDDSRFSYIESSKTEHDAKTEETKSKEKRGLRIAPGSDLESLERRFGHKVDGEHQREKVDPKSYRQEEVAEQNKAMRELRTKKESENENNSEEGESTGKHGKRPLRPTIPPLMDAEIFNAGIRLVSGVLGDFAEFRLEMKKRFNDLSKRNETLIFSMLKTGLHTIADVERTEGGGIRVTRPPKDKKRGNVTEDDDGRVTRFTVALDHEFNICTTCGDKIEADSEFYVTYDHAMKGNTIRVFDTDACRSLWVKANRSIGLGWSDDVATIRNLAYGYAITGIALHKKEHVREFIDWIEAGAKDKDSQQSLIIGPENRGGRSKEIRWADEGVKSLEDYGNAFMKSTDPDVFPIRVEWNNASVYRNAITEFIKFVKDELKKDTAAEEKS